MLFKSKIYFIILSIFLSGCTIIVTPKPISEIRGDGIIKLAYTYNIFEIPNIQWDLAYNNVRNTCNNWGYDDTRIFGTQEVLCSLHNDDGACLKYTAIIPYQCVGAH